MKSVLVEHQRSKSADYLIVRPVSKRDEEYVRQFVTPSSAVTAAAAAAATTTYQGYDSDRTDMRTAAGRQLMLGPLPPSPLVPAEPWRAGRRDDMQLDGLVAFTPGEAAPHGGSGDELRRTDSDRLDETGT